MIGSQVHQMANLCLALLVSVSAYHITRVLGGHPASAWLIGGTVIVALATVDSMIGALMSRAPSGIKAGGAIVVMLGVSVCGHIISIKTSQMAFAVTQYRQMDTEQAESAEALHKRVLVHQAADLHNDSMQASSYGQKRALRIQLDQINSEIATISTPASATERAYNGPGGVQATVQQWSTYFAVVLDLLCLALAIGKGAWLAANDSTRRRDEFEPDISTSKPVQATPMSPSDIERLSGKLKRRADSAPVPAHRHPRRDGAAPDPTVVEALKSLGYKQFEAKRLADTAAGDTTEARIKSALSNALPAEKRVSGSLQTDIAKVRDAIAAGALTQVSVRTIKPITGGGSDRRRKIIAHMVDNGDLRRNSDRTVSIINQPAIAA